MLVINKALKYISLNKLFVTLFVLLLGMLLLVHGLFPNMIGPGTVAGRFMILGFMECGSQSLSQLVELKCALVGGYTGGLMPTGSPVYVAGALLIRVLGIDAEWALTIVSLFVMIISLLGIYKLITSFGVTRYIALFMGFLYLTTVGVMSMQSFGGTYWGFLLMPAAIYVVRTFIKILDTRQINNRKLLLILGLWTTLATLQIFTDGYTFFMTLTASVVFIAFTFWRKWFTKKAIRTYLVFIFSILVAYILYTNLIPGTGSWGHTDISLVRAMGLDLSTVFRPSSGMWWSNFSSFKVEASKLWGDGSNSAYNYIGFSVIILAAYGFFVSVNNKKLTKKNKLSLTGLIILGVISFTLSLGPSLKWNEQRPELNSGVVSHKSYLMPSEEAITGLPTSLFIDKAPGLSAMRAIYRWHFLTQLVLIISAAVGIQYIIDRKSYKFGVPLLVLVFIELSPNPYVFIKNGFQKGEQINTFDSQVIKPLSIALKKNEMILFYPNAEGGNDYLANYIAPHLSVRTFNVGNDKAVVYAKPGRPVEVLRLLDFNDDNRTEKDEALVQKVLDDKTVDAVVVPYFDLRWNSYGWPPRTKEGVIRGKDFANRISDNPNVDIQHYNDFMIIRDKD